MFYSFESHWEGFSVSLLYSGLKSYHLKTVFLNLLEKTPPDFWCDEKIEECFYLLLDHVTQAIEKRICPHYWLYGIDLFDKLTEKEVIKVVKKCNYIKKILHIILNAFLPMKEIVKASMQQGCKM